MMKQKERRKFERFEFSYPVDLKIFATDYDGVLIPTFLKDISMGGFCIQFPDRYMRIDLQQVKNVRVKLKILQPDGETMFLLGSIRWSQRKKTDGGQMMIMGIEFNSLANWQAEKLEKFILLKGKDHKMLWNLWDAYIHRAA